MITTRSRTSRAAVVTLAMAGVFGLSACQGETTVEGGSPSAPAATSSSAPTSEAPSTTEAAPSTTESSPATTEAPSSSTSAPAAGGNAALTPEGTTLKFGQPGTYNDGDDDKPELISITPKSLTVAPDSVFTEQPRLKKADGNVYYLNFDVTNVNATTSQDSNTVNGLFLHPKLATGAKGKRLYGDTAACKSDSNPLPVGSTASVCYIYQIDGATITDVEFKKSDSDITWTK